MKLTNSNYFSPEAQLAFMSVSQFKDFDRCEAMALAKVTGEWQEAKGTALLVGSYVDAYFEGSLEQFQEENTELYLKNGGLKSEYRQAHDIIRRIERDELFMQYLAGEKQVICTGEIEGVPVKIKIDALHPDKIVDLKVMKDFAPIWKDSQKMTFIQAWDYDLQGAVYQAIEGNKKPFFIAGATKEKETDIGIFQVPQEFLNERLNYFKGMVHRYADIKKGLLEPVRCEHCDYCKRTKVLTDAVDLRELIYEME